MNDDVIIHYFRTNQLEFLIPMIPYTCSSVPDTSRCSNLHKTGLHQQRIQEHANKINKY